MRSITAAALLVGLALGCASDRRGDEMDKLRREGYGFDNPNAERAIKRMKEGRSADPDDDDVTVGPFVLGNDNDD